MVMVRLVSARQRQDWQAVFCRHLDCRQPVGVQVEADWMVLILVSHVCGACLFVQLAYTMGLFVGHQALCHLQHPHQFHHRPKRPVEWNLRDALEEYVAFCNTFTHDAME